ncbi:MAG: family 16 glycosylhydrolase [Rikenellaceae bacterium]
MKRLFTLLLLSGFVSTTLAQSDANNPASGLTVPKKSYEAYLNFDDAPKHKSNKYPLSDQDNRGGWKLQKKLSEEFSGKQLDQDKWYPNNPNWIGREPTCFHESNFSVRDGYGVFKINQHGDEALPEGYTHSAGFIVSKSMFLYGYYEARLKPNKSPWITGYWMSNPYDKEWRTEIDMCENAPGIAGNENDLNSNFHVFFAPEDKGNVKKHFSIGKKYHIPFNLSDDFHVWGMDWSEEYIRLYLDGVLYREIENEYWHQELRINVNNESNKWFKALPDGDLGVDEEYLIDYIRVWKRK